MANLVDEEKTGVKLSDDEYNAKQNYYSGIYNNGRAQNNPDLMQWANDQMNVVRENQGEEKQYASQDIQNQRNIVAGASANLNSSGTSGSNDYSSYINEMYGAKQDAALAALESAYQKNTAALDQAEEQLPGTYQNAKNQTAASSEQAKRNFAEYAAANGLNSGAGGQAELSRSMTLQGNLNSLSEAQADALSDLNLQRTQLESDYNSAIATARADGNYELAGALYQEKVRRQEADTAERQYQDSLQYQLANYNYQRQQDALARQDAEYNRKLQIAQLLAQYGDFSGYEAMNIDTTQMQKEWKRQYGR